MRYPEWENETEWEISFRQYWLIFYHSNAIALFLMTCSIFLFSYPTPYSCETMYFSPFNISLKFNMLQPRGLNFTEFGHHKIFIRLVFDIMKSCRNRTSMFYEFGERGWGFKTLRRSKFICLGKRVCMGGGVISQVYTCSITIMIKTYTQSCKMASHAEKLENGGHDGFQSVWDSPHAFSNLLTADAT